MSNREKYNPGPASGAHVDKDGEKWTLVHVREFRHPPAKVWKALTEPEHLREWAPFDADRSLGTVGTAMLSTVGAPKPIVAETQIKRADAPKSLEFNWGGQDIRWELEPFGTNGTRLTPWHNINRKFIAMGAAGWHVSFDVLEHLLDEQPIGRVVGPDAMKLRITMKNEPTQNASKLLDQRIRELSDWRGPVLARLRALIKKADPAIVEAWKWRGTPVWEHDGMVCTGEAYKNVVKTTFAKGASLADPASLFNSSLEGNTRRAIDIHEGEKINEAAFQDLVRAAVALNTIGSAPKTKAAANTTASAAKLKRKTAPKQKSSATSKT